MWRFKDEIWADAKSGAYPPLSACIFPGFCAIRAHSGGVAERFKATVLKTVVRETAPWVRIPPPPPIAGWRKASHFFGPTFNCEPFVIGYSSNTAARMLTWKASRGPMGFHSSIGIGLYTAPEAARLLHVPILNVRRWIGGYSFKHNGKTIVMPPLWAPQLPLDGEHIELGFRDLIELRFVAAFVGAGLGLKTIRHCLEYAKECVQDDRPFSTRKFQTDGRTIFLESANSLGEAQLLDLKKKQYTIKAVIEQSFKDLDIDGEAVARWRPFKGKESIIIDPERVFGQPIAAKYNIPTVALSQAVEAEKSEREVARLFEVPLSVVIDAVAFERSLAK
jgi:uncharacterized protein (DUF433 family)